METTVFEIQKDWKSYYVEADSKDQAVDYFALKFDDNDICLNDVFASDYRGDFVEKI